MNPDTNYTAEQQYYQQWGYYYNTQTIPQGDPSNALSSMVQQLQQQTQQRQALGALAAASVSSVLGTNKANNTATNNNNNNNYNNYNDYNYGNERSIINYNDISAPSSLPQQQQQEEEVKQQNSSKVCCGRWLKSATAIAQHEKLHVKCPSCDHMCLKSVLSDHEEVAHGKLPAKEKKSRPDGVVPPNAPKINTPEELAAWIEARKKNWPSKATIERKEKEEAERKARGEIPTNNNNRKRKNTQENNSAEKKQRSTAVTNEHTLVATVYNSDSDSDDLMDPEKDAITSKDPTSMGHISLPEATPRKRLCRYFLRGKCGKGDQCTFLHEKPPPKTKQQQQKQKPKQTTPRKSNLLFKLLEKEIKQEKSVILQCLRYIVDNNFLGEGNT